MVILKQHEHVTAFQLGLGLDRSERFEVLCEALEHVQTLLRVGHLAAAEHDGDLDARALLEEAQDVTLLGLVIAHIDLRSELHFLNLDLGLVLTSLLGLHGLLVLELAVVHDLAHGRLGVGRDLHQVKVLVVGDALRITSVEQTQLRSIDADETDTRGADLIVDAGVIRLSYLNTSFLQLEQKTRPLHQVKVLVVGDALRITSVEQTQLRSIDADETDTRGADLIVDAGVIRLSYLNTSFLQLEQKTRPPQRYPGLQILEVKVLVVGDALRITSVEPTQDGSNDADETDTRGADLIDDAGVIRLSYLNNSFLQLEQKTRPP